MRVVSAGSGMFVTGIWGTSERLQDARAAEINTSFICLDFFMVIHFYLTMFYPRMFSPGGGLMSAIYQVYREGMTGQIGPSRVAIIDQVIFRGKAEKRPPVEEIFTPDAVAEVKGSHI